MNDRVRIIYYFWEEKYKNKGKKISEKDIEKESKTWANLEKFVTDKALKKMKRNDNNILFNYCLNNDNKNYLLKIIDQNSLDYVLKEIANINNIMEIQKYYINYKFESKQKDILALNQFIQSRETEINFDEYLKDLEVAKQMNIRFGIINYLFDFFYKDKDKTEEKLNDCAKKWQIYEQLIKYKKFSKIRLQINRILLNYVDIQENNKESFIKIFDNESLLLLRNNYKNKKQRVSF